MSTTPHALSKTSFLKYEQCHKAFFLYKNHPYLRDKISTDKQLTFKRGHDVGYFAQQLFPGGIDVSQQSKNAPEAVELTSRLVAGGQNVIYEATFLYNGVLIMVDILTFDGQKYNAYEVKSSLKVSETYLKDAYLQYYVLHHCLPQLEDLFLVTLNPDYVRGAEIEPKKLFRRRSVKEKAKANFPYFEHQVAQAHLLLEQNKIPDIAVGRHCFKPYQCDYFGTCWKDFDEQRSIFNLPLVSRDQLFEWHQQGLRNVDDLNETHFEKDLQRKVKSSFSSGDAIIDKEGIAAILSKIQAPYAVMDMEIWSAAIPQIEGTRCFEQVPFLVSFFNGLEFSHCFLDYNCDEREEFAKALIMLSEPYNTIVVYDKNLELAVINRLVILFPQYTVELNKISAKMLDLFDVFLKMHFYHPSFRNSFSLKSVTSALLPEVKYARIGSGLEAMNFFETYRNTEPSLEKDTLKEDLLDYCNTDCRATFELTRFLQQLV